ncbi:PEP-CTERM sorting domain-containing protein [Nostoc sp. MS1]|uniref:PEP-CTERM sorting domain-containing protein n=1 Tax=Nostoc sp. MS1 TaxID=2764711 RepID=UPI001CC51086|nr:PEP-CTERM sorting domain-containing protein [Nostoc sp. MS1]BCL35028.1 hypothetical protein NSMS1_14750 [Nostoc sp. MS1]
MRTIIKSIIFGSIGLFLATSITEPTSAAVISGSFKTPPGIFEIIDPPLGKSQGILSGTFKGVDKNGDGFITVELRPGDGFLPSYNELTEFEITSSNFEVIDTILGPGRILNFTLSSDQGNFVLGFRQEISSGKIFEFSFTEGFPSNASKDFNLNSSGLRVSYRSNPANASAFSAVFNSSNPIQNVPEPFTMIGAVASVGIGFLFKKEHSKRLVKVKGN